MRTRDALRHRAGAHRTVLSLAFVTVLLTLTMASTVSLLHRAANDAAVTGVLTAATLDERVVRVEAELEDDTDLAALDGEVRERLTGSLALARPAVWSRAVSASYALPGPDPEEPELTVFASYGDEPADGLELVAGSWPAASSGASSVGPVAVAMPRPAADRIGVSPGDRWTVRNRFTDEPVDVELTGVFVVADPDAAAWLGDTLLTRGVRTGSFTTYGPLVVGPATFADRFLDEATGSWTADPRLAEVPPARLAELRTGMTDLDRALDSAGLSVETDLTEVLDRVDAPLNATSATVVLGSAPLVLLAVGALLTAGRLVGDRRRVELALLRARGASTAQLVTVALLEALVLTVPAVLLAPVLGRLLVATWGPGRLSGGGAPGLEPAGWWITAAVGTVAALMLVLPTLRREELTVAVRSGSGSRRAALRLGAVVLVLLAAAVAAWQLERYDSPLRAGEPDPVLVGAPALLLLAGCLVVLRALPAALAAAQPWARRTRGLTGALAAWTVSRQLGRQVGPVLTVLLAASVAAFSLTWLASWSRSAADRAAFDTGADLRVEDPGRVLTHSGLAGTPGTDRVVPVARSTDSFGDARAELLAMDAAAASEVLVLRDDLADRPASDLLTSLADATDSAGLPVPDGTTALELTGPAAARPAAGAPREALVQDDTGMVHALRFERRAGGSVVELGHLPPPMSLLAIRHRTAPGAGAAPGDPVVRPVDVAGTRGEPLVPEGGTWQRRAGATRTALLLAGRLGGGALPVLVTRGLAETVGDQPLVADANGLSLRLDVVGVLEGVPSVDPGTTEGIVVDLAAMNRVVLVQSGGLPTSDQEWWLDVGGADLAGTAAAVRTLAAEHPQVTVTDRQSRLKALESGPVGTAVTGVLAVALVAALLTVLSGLAAAAGALGPTRRRERALLRAIGAAPRQVARLAVLDRVGLLAVAGLTGVAVGLAVAWWTLPRVALTDGSAAPYPSLLVEVPWTPLGLGVVGTLSVGLLLHTWETRTGRATAPDRGEELP